MKFIVDAQLPKTLSDLLNHNGLDSIHTLELPERNATDDKTIVRIASNEGRIIITKDSDFLESYLLYGVPDKLIVIKTGNISNRELLKLFQENLQVICKLIKRSNYIEITRFEIAEHG